MTTQLVTIDYVSCKRDERTGKRFRWHHVVRPNTARVLLAARQPKGVTCRVRR